MSLQEKMYYTYGDIMDLDDGNRYELYDGQPVALASPSNIHQEISLALVVQLYGYLRGKRCKVYHAPFDVRLFEQENDRSRNVKDVVQPDITVVCDESKLAGRGCKGAPDFIIEILSPSTMRTDRLVKFNLYQKAGVKEYWIVDPETQVVLVHKLEEGQYGSPEVYTSQSSVPVGVLENCAIDLKSVFE